MWLLAKPSCSVIERKQTLVLKISNETFCIFFGMLLLGGCHKPPERKIYWETSPETFVKVMSDSIPRLNNLFFEISIVVATNNLINKNNSQSFVVVYKKTSSDNEWKRMVQRVIVNDSDWQRWVQWITRSDNKWYNEWQRVVQEVAKSDNKWQVWQRVTKKDNEWVWMTASDKTNENKWN